MHGCVRFLVVLNYDIMGIILWAVWHQRGHHSLSCAAPNFQQAKNKFIINKGRLPVGTCPALRAHAVSALPILDIVFVALVTAMPG